MARPSCKGTASPFSGLLLEVFKPLVAEEPFFVNLVVGAVVLGLDQEIVQPVDEVSVAPVDGPCQRLVSERLVEQDHFALAFLSKGNGVERQVVNKSIYFAIEEVHNAFLLGFKGDVGGIRDHALGCLLAGSAELGGDFVLLVVQVLVRFDLAGQFLVDQDALADDDVGLGKADLRTGRSAGGPS